MHVYAQLHVYMYVKTRGYAQIGVALYHKVCNMCKRAWVCAENMHGWMDGWKDGWMGGCM